MSCIFERFKAFEGGGGFPPVSEYDYVTNPFFRGPSNRDFRWEEVSVENSYSFSEITLNGNLEENNLDFSETGFLKLTGSLVGSNTYDDWTLSGDGFWAIGNSGGYFSEFDKVVTPISDESSVIFWATGQDLRINNTVLYASSEGVNNPNIQSQKRHQVFLNTYSISGDGYLNVYLEGYDGSLINYYDPYSGSWVETKPTGRFTLPANKYSFIKFDFIPSNFPGNNPANYRLVLEQTTGYQSSPVVVDDIHIDRYLKRDAFTDFLIPTGYFLEVTPDLGWHNSLDLFEDSDNNPFLTSFGPFTSDNGGLKDNLDGTVQVTLSESQFKDVVTNSYSKYLWRAVPLSPNLVIGQGGTPVRFNYLGQILIKDFTLDEFEEDESNPIKVITGKRNERIKVLVNGEEHPNMEYPTSGTWRLTINLDVSEKTITICAKDSGGARSDPYYITLRLNFYKQLEASVWNTFDEYGLLMDIDRLPQENNVSYKERIKDVFLGGGSATYNGVVSASSRELGLDRYPEAITLIPEKTKFNLKRQSSFQLEVTSYSLRIRKTDMVRNEKKFVDPVYSCVILDKLIAGAPISVSLNGKDISESQIEVIDYGETNRPDLYKIFIKDKSVAGKVIDIKYNYFEELFFKDFPTIGDLVNKLNSLDIHGNKLVKASVNYLLSGDEVSRGLYKVYLEFDETSDIDLSWSPIILNKISDPTFVSYHISEEKNPRKSKFYKYIQELKTNSRILWGAVQADRDFWDATLSNQEGLDSYIIPMDPKLSYYYTAYSSTPNTGRTVINELSRDHLSPEYWSDYISGSASITSNNLESTFTVSGSTSSCYKYSEFVFEKDKYYLISADFIGLSEAITDGVIGVSVAPEYGHSSTPISEVSGPHRYGLLVKYNNTTSGSIRVGLGVNGLESGSSSAVVKNWMVEKLADPTFPPSEYTPPSLNSNFNYSNLSTISGSVILENKGSVTNIDKEKTALLIGDSFSNEETEYPFILNEYTRDWTIYPNSLNGRALSQISTFISGVYNLDLVSQGIGAESFIPEYSSQSTKAKYFIYSLGVNDLLLLGDSLDVLKNKINSSIDISKNVRPDSVTVLTTIPPFGSSILTSSSKETIRKSFNIWLNSEFNKNSVYVFDLASLLEDPNNLANLNPEYNSGDGLHLNSKGQQLLAKNLHLRLEEIFELQTWDSSSALSTIFDAVQAWSRNYKGYSQEIMKNIGLDYKFFQPGVAHRNDLSPEIFTTFSITNSLEDNSTAISPQRNNNNNDPIFSGQR